MCSPQQADKGGGGGGGVVCDTPGEEDLYNMLSHANIRTEYLVFCTCSMSQVRA